MTTATTSTFETRYRELRTGILSSRATAAKLERDGSVHDCDPRLARALAEIRVEQELLRRADDQLREQLEELDHLSKRATIEHDRFRKVFDGGVDGYVIANRFGVIREANRAAGAMLATAPRALCGKPLTTFFSPADAVLVRRAFSDAECGGAVEHELLLEPPEGAPVSVVLRGAPAVDGGTFLWTLRARSEPAIPATGRGKTSGWFSSRSSETPDVERLARVARDAQEIAARERKLRVQCERAAVAKEHFLAILAHDLRGPLHAVLGWTQMLQRERLDCDARARGLGVIERNVNVQLRLIEEILDISRLTEGKLQISMHVVDIATTLRRSVEALLPIAKEKELLLELLIQEGGYTTFADDKRVEQIIANLVLNAMKFTQRGGRVTVSLGRAEGFVEIAVADTGCGIAPSRLERIFERFHQQQPAAAIDEGGLGLGLFIVKQLVELHAGSCAASSPGIGQGATFTVRLPLYAVDHPPLPSEHRMPAGAEEIEEVRVLVVDDDADAREILCAVLESHGAAVASAKDTKTTLALVGAFRPHVIISDIGLGEDDGYALARQIRDMNTHIACVAVSGFADRAHAERAVQAGFSAFLTKPVDCRALVDAVKSAALEHGEHRAEESA
jgi:signal transduction histidine kinase/CheY-like chemotaxis protein